MAEMSQLLGQIFNTMEKDASAPTEEDLVKQANLQFFGELCRAEGINVEHLNDNQVADLFKVAMEVKAEKDGEKPGKEGKPEGKKPEEKEKEAAAAKLAAANEEYLQKRAAHVKCAEADFMGRLMAHSFADEMRKIAASENPFAKKPEGKEGKEGKEDKEKEEKEKEASVRRAAELVAALEQSKQASAASTSATSTPNFDEVAAYRAIDMLKSASVDADLAFNRINASFVLGFPESVKMAAASTPEQALEYRALELCEAAGFQVDWTQV